MMQSHDNNAAPTEGQESDYEGVDRKSGNMKRDYDEAFPSENELSLMSKPERKRFREKRRRDRVNASFDELRALLIRIDPQCSNRVDISQLELIDRSIVVIKGLLEESGRNNHMAREFDSIQRDRVNMVVPFVNPFENESPSEAMANYANHSISESPAPQHLVFQHHQEIHHHAQHPANAPPISQIASSHPQRYQSQESVFAAPPYSQKVSRVSTATSGDAGNQSRVFNDQQSLQY